MIRVRPYKASDVNAILSWCQDEKVFYQWTAGILGKFPITKQEFGFVESLMPFTAFDETGIVGFFTLRNPNELLDELRFGFVIIDSDKRGNGYGKEMIRLGLKFAFEIYGAKRASLGVFENTAIKRLVLKMWFLILLRHIVFWAKNGSVKNCEWKTYKFRVHGGVAMASSKEYLSFILEQLSGLEDISYKAMMGEYILYYRQKVIGGIYDDRFLVKPTKSANELMPNAPKELPYEGAKEMLLVEDVDDKEFLSGLLNAMVDELPDPKKRKK